MSESPLRAARLSKGLSLRDMETLTGIDRGHLSKIERGAVNPSVARLKQLARVLGLTDLSAHLASFRDLPKAQ